jgi:glycosyltransferase involved in cell wall biosynthesis
MRVDISIVIPLYNKEDYIHRVLACIENQTFTNWECIIIDDGSTDSSASVVKEFISKRGERWRYVFQKNMGQAAARNLGIAESQGKYVAFLDADDLWPNYKLQSQFEALESNPRCVVVLSPFVIFNQQSFLPRLVRHASPKKMLSGWLSMCGFGGGIESVGLIRQSVLSSKFNFDESLTTSSGLDLALRLSEFGEILFLKRIGLIYRINEGQWHTNMFELERNMEIIREKHGFRSSSSLDPYHSAYLYWAGIRKNGWRSFLPSIIRVAFQFENKRLIMIVCLVFRNIKARVLGFAYYKKIKRLISDLD